MEERREEGGEKKEGGRLGLSAGQLLLPLLGSHPEL